MTQPQEKNFFRQYELTLPDGDSVVIDAFDLFRKADFLAYNYGIGGCKTFSEFVNMVNNEDPFIINNLVDVAGKRIRVQNGEKDEVVYRDVEETYVNNTRNKSYTSKSSGKNEQGVLLQFLKDFGTTEEEIKDAKEKLASGKIEIPEDDFSWITAEELASPDFDLQGTLKKMRDYENKSVNIKVSLDKMMAKAARKRS